MKTRLYEVTIVKFEDKRRSMTVEAPRGIDSIRDYVLSRLDAPDIIEVIVIPRPDLEAMGFIEV